MGGSTPPVQAMLTLKPTPAPDPTCGKKRSIESFAQEHVVSSFTMSRLSMMIYGAHRSWRESTLVGAYLLGSSAAGKKVAVIVAMEGDVEDVGVTVEGLLRAVAMVNVLQRQVAEVSEGERR